MGFHQEIEVTVSIDESHIEDAGYHHEDDCNHDDCPSSAVEEQIAAHNTAAHRAATALHDWHETTHGYTIWSGCRQEPCCVLTLDFRKRT